MTAPSRPVSSVARLRTGLLAAALAGALGAGCTTPPEPPLRPSSARFDYYVCEVEPILEQGCSYMNCHGREDQALRVYSLGKLRADPTMTAFARAQQQLTPAEITANFNSARAFFDNVPVVEQSLLLREPLPGTAGGPDHFGGAIWTGVSDPRYQIIRSWAKDATVPATDQGRCTALMATLGVTP